MTRHAVSIAVALALASIPVAAAVGPALPDVNGAVTNDEVSYVVKVHGSRTVVSRRIEGRVAATASIRGAWGVPLVTLTSGQTGGLGPSGRLLVLGDDVHPEGTLRARCHFAVLDTTTLEVAQTIALRGDYSFDALSPSDRWLYLIHHVASTSNRYQVQAYDLRAKRLLPGVIADKSQIGWVMAGYPVARATGPGGRWVYTLYERNGSYPFVHALDTADRYAICIKLDWDSAAEDGVGAATLRLSGRTLQIAGEGARFALDTETFGVTRI